MWPLTSKVTITNCLSKLLRQPPIPFFTVKSIEERLATWHPRDFKCRPSSLNVSRSSTNSIFSVNHLSINNLWGKRKHKIKCFFFFSHVCNNTNQVIWTLHKNNRHKITRGQSIPLKYNLKAIKYRQQRVAIPKHLLFPHSCLTSHLQKLAK